MKIIVAYIRPETFDEVIFALHQVNSLQGVSTSKGSGFGNRRMVEPAVIVEKEEENFHPHIRIEIACSDDSLQEIIDTIVANARTGIPGDGIIMVFPIEKCISIRREGTNGCTQANA